MIQEIISSPLFSPISILVSLFIGAIITYFVARHFFELSSRDSRLILRSLEEARLVKLNRDKKGRIIGLQLEASVELKAKSNFKAAMTVTPGEKK